MTGLTLLDNTPVRHRADPAAPPDVASMTLSELQAFLGALGEPAYRAEQVFRWLHRRGVASFSQMTDLGRALREKLQGAAVIGRLEVAQVQAARDGTRKYRMRTRDGALVESVFIPSASAADKNTLCISSQVGCAMGCTFCATGAMGLDRHLTASEIVDQVNRVWADLGAVNGGFVPDPSGEGSTRRLLTNLVFMGMGEPLHNVEHVLRAVEILTHEHGHQFSPRRVTVSTSGLLPQMKRLMAESDVQLAVSLSGTTDAQRVSIMPVNRKYPLGMLLAACREVPLKARRRITFEYVLLAGINDADEDATRLVRILKGLRCKVNLIPFNEHPLGAYRRPPRERTLRFQSLVRDGGINALIREARGDDIDAACGMLGGTTLDAARAVPASA
ncbi:MAG: 23S rRNA (adenine(2503)-C(2))-methyltransferase RlmN [Deltaproteobacteria bacterium]|nr:23S rRNA (adenine(2503)-C(2))-methyltransferase RlmN [Deltaproteobacteria bacterium]